jgi:hypothetical protein
VGSVSAVSLEGAGAGVTVSVKTGNKSYHFRGQNMNHNRQIFRQLKDIASTIFRDRKQVFFQALELKAHP